MDMASFPSSAGTTMACTTRSHRLRSSISSVCKIASLCLFIFFIKQRFTTTTAQYQHTQTLIQQRGLLERDDLIENSPEVKKSLRSSQDGITTKINAYQLGNGVSDVNTVNELMKNVSGNGTDDAKDSLPCDGVIKHIGFANSCEYVKAISQCKSASVIDYTRFFFCTCSKFPIIGYVVLIVWLFVLFYTLGNTAADYFCCSLEKLSDILKCPPTVAGVTLLPLGNGAPDVFASIAAFIGAGAGEVGLNSVLGGSLFVTTVVAGCVNLVVAKSQSVKEIDKSSFIRDVGFFLFTIFALALVLIAGHVYLWSALAFLSIYALYAIAVAASELLKKSSPKSQWSQIQLLPFTTGPSLLQDEDDSIYSPLMETSSVSDTQSVGQKPTLPQWRWTSNVAIYSHQSSGREGETCHSPLGWSDDADMHRYYSKVGKIFTDVLEWPLSLPRRLTIPVVENDRWSRNFALASAGLAPVFFAFVVDSQNDDVPIGTNKAIYVIASVIGLFFVLLAYFTTRPERPPRKFLMPWVVAGFFMSIVWFFVVANELVALLVTFGMMLAVDPSILGLTVLAWGNSIGDLMADIALACNGGDGVQIAVSGCYAGPMFNTLIGLGISMVLGSWSSRPNAFTIPRDSSLYYTLLFLVIGLLWSLIVLPIKKMQPNKLLGIGLLVLYLVFLLFRLSLAVGLIPTSW